MPSIFLWACFLNPGYCVFVDAISKLRIKHKLIELKQKNLNQQMNPHFVYNCLNSIQSYIFQNEVTRSVDYLSKLPNSCEESCKVRK